MKLTKTTRINITAEINGANVTINCEFGETAPTQVSVNGWYNGEGVSSNLNRNYTNGETGISYSPVSKQVIYPYNASFDTELKAIVENIFTNYATL